MRPDGPRNPVVGPETGPEDPFPVRLSGPVIKGFGRGSKELGIPTANISAEMLAQHPELDIGVYYGVAALDPSRFDYSRTETSLTATSSEGESSGMILPAVLSIGYNPFYKNKERSIEIHIMPPLSSPSPTASSNSNNNDGKDKDKDGKQEQVKVKFHKMPDFYATPLNVLILGYIRPEYDYVSLDALVEDIRVDCEVARQSLRRKAYARYLGEGGGDGNLGNAASESDEDVKAQRRWLTTFDGNQHSSSRTSGL